MTVVKFDLAAWSDAELKIIGAIAMLGCLEEVLFETGDKKSSEAAMGIRLAIEGALVDMESGRVRG